MSATTPQFIADFRVLHDRHRSGELPPVEKTAYFEARTQFVRMIVVAQSLGHAGHTLRSDLRIAKMLKVEIRPDDGKVERLTTIDIATRGFATMAAEALPLGSGAGFTLFLPAPGGAIAGRVVVASLKAQGTLTRISFRFEDLLATAAEALDVFLIDSILERLVRITKT